MRSRVMERASLAATHDFNELSIHSDIEVRFVRQFELRMLAEMANRLVPGVQITAPILSKYVTFDPECIFTFIRRNKLVGAVAFLYLNRRGHDALILDELSLNQPDLGLLAKSDEAVSAIYIWAVAATGRGIAGYGKVVSHLRTARYVNANCFAQPSTKAGRDWLIRARFQPIPSFQRDLWCYQRPWNRLPPTTQLPNVSARSIVNAWH
jgi:hypothetical protein